MAVRLIFWGGARETNADGSPRQLGINDNSAFKFAELNIKKAYSAHGDDARMFKITTAAEMVSTIASFAPNTIASLDVLSHGSPLSLNFSKKPYGHAGSIQAG